MYSLSQYLAAEIEPTWTPTLGRRIQHRQEGQPGTPTETDK